MPTRKKEQSQPRLKSITIERLKGVQGLEMSLEGHNVTAILGRNGSGKSTVLQAIYCLYQPKKEQFAVYRRRHKMNQFEEIPDSKFSHFFKHVDGRLWTESRLSAMVYWREGAEEFCKPKYYKKSKRQWTPRMGFKPMREIYYIGINSCVPAIERVIKGKVTYRTNTTNELQHAEEIRAAASRIMGYEYSQLYYSNETKRLFFNVEKEDTLIHALALGAGEQRLFTILETLYNADKYALITIDELDLTLHTAALLRLIDEMVRVAEEKHLQIVFTTHRQEVMSRKDINVRYLMQTPEKTLCLEDPTDDFSTKVTMFAPLTLRQMNREDRVRACYQHCCLKYVAGEKMTNESLRGRLEIAESSYPIASKIISDTIAAGLVRLDDASKSRKYAQYVPKWA